MRSWILVCQYSDLFHHLPNCSRYLAGRPQAGRKVLTVQALPASDKTNDDRVGKMGGFSLHAGVAAGAVECDKLEHLCRYISRPAVAEQRLKRVFNGAAFG